MRYLYIMVLLAYCMRLSAQVDTSTMSHINIEELTITVLPHPAHEQTLELDDNTDQNLISDLLESKSTVYIKSYGGGSLATLSLRGGSATQTQLQWEGIPLNNPMLGISDLSLVPLNLFSHTQLRKGGLSAQNGSGAITGILNMENRLNLNGLGAEAQLSAGSFGELGSQIMLSAGNDKASISVKAFTQKSDNDFTYYLGNGDSRINTNGDYKAKGLLVNAQLWPSDSERITLSTWIQNTHRGIPPTTVQNSSSAFQDDILRRYKLSYLNGFEKFSLSSQVAYFDEDNDYTDPDRLTEAENRFKTFYNNTALQTGTKHNYFLKYEYSHTRGTSKSYADEGNDYRRFALIAQTNLNWGYLKLDGILRKEWNNIVDAPLIPSTTLSYVKNQFITSLKVSREFRSPTLNELYWQPVGNLDLLPELGWNEELNVALRNSPQLPNFSVTAHHRKINNWILWIPLNGTSGAWAPTNLTSVRSYGLDMDLDYQKKIKNSQTQIATGYAYNKSTNLSTVNQQGIEEGDQLIYTPVHKAYINLGYEYKNISVEYTHQYTSSVTAINEDLNDFMVANTSVSYTINTQKINHNFYINLNNIFNSSYRIIERRPMPGRNFNIGWTIKIIQK